MRLASKSKIPPQRTKALKKIFYVILCYHFFIYNYKNRYKDLFFALSHGVNFGNLKKRKTDEREIIINNLMKKFPKLNYNFLGIANEKPKWNFYKYLFDRSGKLINTWSYMTKPDNNKIIIQIDKLI